MEPLVKSKRSPRSIHVLREVRRSKPPYSAWRNYLQYRLSAQSPSFCRGRILVTLKKGITEKGTVTSCYSKFVLGSLANTAQIPSLML